MKVMDSARAQGANGRNTYRYFEDLQRGHRVKDALSCFEISVPRYQLRVARMRRFQNESAALPGRSTFGVLRNYLAAKSTTTPAKSANPSQWLRRKALKQPSRERLRMSL